MPKQNLNGGIYNIIIRRLYINNRVYIGHIGDSRIYRIRQDIMRKITVDHSYVQKLVKDGTITKEEAIHHPKKNMLMKAIRL